MTQNALFQYVTSYFQHHMPVAETELHYRTPYELLVAVILSAQCTDKRVNRITPAFFEQYPTAEVLAEASPEAVLSVIRSCSYPASKSRHLTGMARMLMSDFSGVVPDQVEDLMRLPGVGRKTANVVVSVAFGKPAIAVDTHVFRVSARIGLTRNARTPLEAEQQLVAGFPAHLHGKAHHWLILHGRYVCTARKPACVRCGLTSVCAFYRSVR